MGVSVAQYVRDAALGRLSYDAGRRAELETGTQQESTRQMGEGAPGRNEAVSSGEPAASAQEEAISEVSQSAALWAQGKLARSRAADVRARAESTRARLGQKT